jgi:hypothetical protein
MSRAQSLLVLAAIGAIAVVGTMAYGLFRQNHVDVYFDNGLATAVTISVDGEGFSVGGTAPVKRQLAPGPHEVVVTAPGPSGVGAVEVERTRVEVVQKNLVTVLIGPEFYVYNVAQAHIYRRARHVYASEESKRQYSDHLFAFLQFFSQPDADYVFVPAPNEITSDSSTATEEEFVVARDVDYETLANMRFDEGNLDEAERAVKKALSLEPCQVNAFRTRIALMTVDGPSAEALEAARGWIAACGDVGLEAHRAYQDAALSMDGKASLLVEYRARRTRDASAENDYLVARLLGGRDAVDLYREAIAKDPSFTRAKLALAYELLGVERYEEALAAVDSSLDGSELAADAAYLFAYAAAGAGRVAETTERLRALSTRDPYNPTLWQARWTSALATEDWNQAERLLQEYQQSAARDPWQYRVQLLGLRGSADEAERRIDLARAQSATTAQASLLHFQSLFASRKYDEAARCLDEIPGGTNPLYRLYAAAGLAMAGEREQATARLQALEGELDEAAGGTSETEFYRIAVRLLKGAAPSGRAITSAREAGFLMLPHAYFLVGAREIASGNSLAAESAFQKSAGTAGSRDFPYLAAKGLAGARDGNVGNSPHSP